MSGLEKHEHAVSCLSSTSSKSTESLEDNIRKILNVVDGKGRVLIDRYVGSIVDVLLVVSDLLFNLYFSELMSD